MFYKILLTLLISTNLYSGSGTNYLEKFDVYRYWSTHLPPQYNPQLVQFIHQPGPLANKLRDKWLTFLGEKQNWPLIAQYYRPTSSVTVQCYAAFSYWHEHQNKKAIQIATPLWLVGQNQPIACDRIFQVLNKQPNWRQTYRQKRVKLALDSYNILLARQLLNHGSPSDKKASEYFYRLHSQPEYLLKIPNNSWHGEETLYALKRMMMLNRSQERIQNYYHLALQKHWLNQDQNQRYCAFMSLYLAMRNKPETRYWFQKVQPKYYTETVIEWQMRYAILHQQWSQIRKMILLMKKPLSPEQNYWLARAELHLNMKESGQLRLQKLAHERNYYGFLASIYRKQPLSFQEKSTCTNYQILKPYSPLLEEIKLAYQQKYVGKASSLLNDFILELPPQEQCTLVDWVSNRLNWPSQAIFMSNQPQLFNQISVRFPTKYAAYVNYNAKQNRLSPEFVYSIIRQESAFHPEIISPVGAKGLMQMMPRTAKLMSQRYHIPYRTEKDLMLPHKNIELGTRYLADLSKHLNHPLLVAAAYNAGPSAAMQWVKNYPAPDIITWIDTLPWKETRNYLKNIVAFNAIYQHRLRKNVTLKEILKPLPGQTQKVI